MKQAQLAVFVILSWIPVLATAGGRPKWIEGKETGFDPQKYLTAVGFGPDRTMAESSAQSNLAKIFETSIHSVSKDYQAAFSKNGEALEVQSVETLNQVTTKQVMSGVKINEVWDDSKGTLYALAVVERAPAAATAKEKITQLDAAITSSMNQAKGTEDKVKQLVALRAAAKAMQERESLNAQLRILATDGQGIPSQYSAADIAGMLGEVADAFTVGVEAEGEAAEDLEQALIQGLNEAGLQVTSADDLEEGAPPFDLLIKAKSAIDGDAGAAGAIKITRCRFDVQMFNNKKKKAFHSFNVSAKNGANSQNEAVRRSISSAKADLLKKIRDAINKEFGPQ